MEKKQWNRGRMSICPDGLPSQITFSCCPKVKKEMVEYCKTHKLLKSQLINEAVLSYIGRNKDVPA